MHIRCTITSELTVAHEHIFLGICCGTGASVALRLWLARRQISSVATQRERVPDAFADKIPPEAHRKAADYTLTKTRHGRLDLLYDSLLLLGWTLGGGLQLLDSLWQPSGWGSIPTGVAMMVSAFAIMALLELPFSAISHVRNRGTFRVQPHDRRVLLSAISPNRRC